MKKYLRMAAILAVASTAIKELVKILTEIDGEEQPGK